jgi:hypothetical protein
MNPLISQRNMIAQDIIGTSMVFTWSFDETHAWSLVSVTFETMKMSLLVPSV